MRSLFVAAVAVTLGACTAQGNGAEAAAANNAARADLTTSSEEGVDQLMNVQGHGLNDAAARNMLNEDAATNRADANLGNGT